MKEYMKLSFVIFVIATFVMMGGAQINWVPDYELRVCKGMT